MQNLVIMLQNCRKRKVKFRYHHFKVVWSNLVPPNIQIVYSQSHIKILYFLKNHKFFYKVILLSFHMSFYKNLPFRNQDKRASGRGHEVRNPEESKKSLRLVNLRQKESKYEKNQNGEVLIKFDKKLKKSNGLIPWVNMVSLISYGIRPIKSRRRESQVELCGFMKHVVGLNFEILQVL